MIIRVAMLAVAGFAGWIAGTLYPAPASVVAKVNPAALQERARGALATFDWKKVDSLLSPAQRTALEDAAMTARAAAGQIITVERVAPEESQTDAPLNAASSMAAVAAMAFEPGLAACPGMTISNGPRVDAARTVVGYAPERKINDVKLAANPTHGACLSSGMGPRNGREHRGTDYYARDGGPILAAGDGKVIELKYRDDYGNMILIDHGKGVYTRYAHLSSFQRGLAVGSVVKAGEQIGLMGNTASYAVPIHLHYEVLTGDYANPKASFGLTPQNVLAAPAAL